MMAIGMIPHGINLRPHENMIYSVIFSNKSFKTTYFFLEVVFACLIL